MVDKIKKLRELTNAGVVECRKALLEAKGDVAKAREILKKNGILIAEKKSDRTLGAGVLKAYIHNNRIGVLLEVRCETDFAAQSREFQELAQLLAFQIAATRAATVKELLKAPYIKDENMTVDDLIKSVVAQVKERIQIERFTRYEF